MPGTNTLKRPFGKEVLECILGMSSENPSWERQAERILAIKTKRHERRAQNEYHKQTRQHRKH